MSDIQLTPDYRPGFTILIPGKKVSEYVNVWISDVKYSDDHCDSKLINQEESTSCDVYIIFKFFVW